MTNSLVHSLEGYFRALFSDIAREYGSARELERDLNRSLHELAIRGDRFATIDLPSVRKHLEKCLEEGLYTPGTTYLCGRASKRVEVPAYCRDLYLQVFNVDGKLKAEPSATAVSALRQLFEGWGKLKNVCKQEAIDEEVDNFLTNERDLRNPKLSWQADVLIEDFSELDNLSFDDLAPSGAGSQLEIPGSGNAGSFLISRQDRLTLQKVCDRIASNLGDFDNEAETERPKHGKGRVSDLRREESKYSFKSWPRKLDLVFPFDRYGTHDLGYHHYLNDFVGVAQNNEPPSKLIAVPKTMSGPRLIGSEPSSHQWIQQLIRNQLETRVKRSLLKRCISFGDQRPNRWLALQGSVDGSIATVDLKSASDRLSCWTIERALRRNFTLLRRIHASRTRTMRNAINDSFDRLILKKCFTQGSACTFPVQTVVYSMIAIAAVITSNDWNVTSQNIVRASGLVRVFGDDIVVPVYALPKLTEMLSFLQLTVNSNKTFSKGKFRESCGLDAFAGVDVTPARVKRFSANPSHEVAQSMLKCSNNFFERGLWNTAAWLQSFLRQYQFPVVGLKKTRSLLTFAGRQDELYDSGGISSFVGTDLSHLRKRWNNNVHAFEYRSHSLANKSKKVPTQSAHDLFEFTSSKSTSVPYLEHLHPTQGGLGVVNKQVSVMRPGWSTFHQFH